MSGSEEVGNERGVNSSGRQGSLDKGWRKEGSRKEGEGEQWNEECNLHVRQLSVDQHQVGNHSKNAPFPPVKYI